MRRMKTRWTKAASRPRVRSSSVAKRRWRERQAKVALNDPALRLHLEAGLITGPGDLRRSVPDAADGARQRKH